MSVKRDYYEILQVSKTSDHGEIKKAYRKLAMEFHPDRNPDNEEAEHRFREIQEAYEVLSDSEKRGLYDQFGHEGLSARGFRPGSGFHPMDDIFDGFQTIFEDFFGGGRRTRGPAKGRDLIYRLQLEFREAALGCSKKIEIERREKCPDCQGKGTSDGAEPESCAQCGGRGKVTMTQGFFSVAQACPICRGTGQIIRKPCKTCQAEKLVRKEVELEVKVPAGVDTGVRLRMTGEGEGAVSGGPSGDLFIEIDVLSDEYFERDGTHLHSRVYVPYKTAVLGGKFRVETLAGEKEIKIPKGIQTPYIHEVKGEGIVDLHSGRKGNLFVECLIETPNHLSAKAKELLLQLDEELESERSPLKSRG